MSRCIFRCSASTYVHRFPHPHRKPELFKQWVEAVGHRLGNEVDPIKVYNSKKVCNFHFKPEENVASHRLLNGAVPSLFLEGVTVSPSTLVKQEHNYVSPGIIDVKKDPKEQNIETTEVVNDVSSGVNPVEFSTSHVTIDSEGSGNCHTNERQDFIFNNMKLYKDGAKKEHQGYTCNECKGPIIGFRYKCLECEDFDLCKSCEGNEAHDSHYMLRVPKPLVFTEFRDVLREIKERLMKQNIKKSRDNSATFRKDSFSKRKKEVEIIDIIDLDCASPSEDPLPIDRDVPSEGSIGSPHTERNSHQTRKQHPNFRLDQPKSSPNITPDKIKNYSLNVVADQRPRQMTAISVNKGPSKEINLIKNITPSVSPSRLTERKIAIVCRNRNTNVRTTYDNTKLSGTSANSDVDSSKSKEVNISRSNEVNPFRNIKLYAYRKGDVNASGMINLNAARIINLNAIQTGDVNASRNIEVNAIQKGDVNASRNIEVNAFKIIDVDALKKVHVDASRNVDAFREDDVNACINIEDDVDATMSQSSPSFPTEHAGPKNGARNLSIDTRKMMNMQLKRARVIVTRMTEDEINAAIKKKR